MLNLALTSDFPTTANQAVIDRMRGRGPRRRIAWIPPLTGMGHERFPAARQVFESHGFSALEYCDIDAEFDEEKLARLDRYDIIHLTGGDPVAFRRNILTALRAIVKRRG
jgi:hypothetical protein